MIAGLVGGGVVLLVFLAFAWWHAVQLRDGERRAAGALVGQEQLKGDLRAMTADRDAQRARADYQERRANALDQELDVVASDDPDPARARGRVLSRLHAAEAGSPAPGGGAGAVPGGSPQQDPAVARVNDTALERPGD